MQGPDEQLAVLLHLVELLAAGVRHRAKEGQGTRARAYDQRREEEEGGSGDRKRGGLEGGWRGRAPAGLSELLLEEARNLGCVA